MIKVEGLTKSFGRQTVLRELSLEVATGTITIIIGRSGGGKSVFLKHLIGLLQPDAGPDPRRRGRRSRRCAAARSTRSGARYGVVFQGGALFDSMSCYENVAFPLREKTRTPPDELTKRVEAALAQVGLEGVGAKYPAEISGGMRKRVAIARALVTEPEIVFFDEPTTGLDPVLVNAIHHLMLDLHRRFRFTAVVVSHEIPEIFEIADTVAMLHEGRDRGGRAAGGHPGVDEPRRPQIHQGRAR